MLARKIESFRQAPQRARHFLSEAWGLAQWMNQPNDQGQKNMYDVARKIPGHYMTRSFAAALLGASIYGACAGAIIAYKNPLRTVQSEKLYQEAELIKSCLKNNIPAPPPPTATEFKKEVYAGFRESWRRAQFKPAIIQGTMMAILLAGLAVPVRVSYHAYKLRDGPVND